MVEQRQAVDHRPHYDFLPEDAKDLHYEAPLLQVIGVRATINRIVHRSLTQRNPFVLYRLQRTTLNLH